MTYKEFNYVLVYGRWGPGRVELEVENVPPLKVA